GPARTGPAPAPGTRRSFRASALLGSRARRARRRGTRGLELVEEAVDDAALARRVGERLADDLRRELRREQTDVVAQRDRGLLALGLDLAVRRLDDARGVVGRLRTQVRDDGRALGTGLLADLRRLGARLLQLLVVLRQRRRGLRLRGLRLGQAALDLRGALVEDRLELRQDGLVEHDRDDDQDHGRPQQVVPGGEEELDALVLLARLRRDVERGVSQRRHQNRKPA